jgi:uncharacterized membrane protein YkvA (DUF1232 family)
MPTPQPMPPDLPPPFPGFWRGLARGLLERVCRLYLTARAPGTPTRLKAASVLVAFYFLFPFDLISDLLPLLGFGDDLFAVSLLGYALSRHANDAIRWRAREMALKVIP